MPTVCNAHHYAPLSPKRPALPEPWIYIGRRHQAFGEASPLANPYTIKEHGEKALELYRRHLANRIKEQDPQILEALQAITDAHTLVCFCKKADGTGLCHGDIVVKAWEYLRRDPQAAPQPAYIHTHSLPTPQPPDTSEEGLMQSVELQQLEQLYRQTQERLATDLEQEMEERHRENAELELASFYQQPAGTGPIDPQLAAEAQLTAYREQLARDKAAANVKRTKEDIERQWETNQRGFRALNAMFETKRKQRRALPTMADREIGR